MGCNESKNTGHEVQRSQVLRGYEVRDSKNDGKTPKKKEGSLAKMKEHATNGKECNNWDSFLIDEKLPAINEEAKSDEDSVDESFYSLDIEGSSLLELDLETGSEAESSSPKVTLTRSSSPRLPDSTFTR